MKSTLIIFLIITLLYILEITVIVNLVDSTAEYWNYATVYIASFKDRHPWILLSMPFSVFLLLFSLKDAAESDARL